MAAKRPVDSVWRPSGSPAWRAPNPFFQDNQHEVDGETAYTERTFRNCRAAKHLAAVYPKLNVPVNNAYGGRHGKSNLERGRARRKQGLYHRRRRSLLPARYNPPSILQTERDTHNLPVERRGQLL